MSTNYLPDYLTIPCVLINDKRMRPIDHLVYGLIYWYSKLKLEKCVASNGTIADLLSTHQSTIANSIGRLNKYGYVRILYDESISSNNRVRTEIIPLIVFAEVSPNGEGGYRQMAKRVSPKSETGVSPYGEHNKNIDKKEYIASSHEPIPLLTEDTKQEEPAPHSKKLQGKTYSTIGYLTALTDSDVQWFIDKFPSLTPEVVRNQAERAFYWLKGKGRTQKDYRAFLRNWLDSHVERSQGGTNQRRVMNADELR